MRLKRTAFRIMSVDTFAASVFHSKKRRRHKNDDCAFCHGVQVQPYLLRIRYWTRGTPSNCLSGWQLIVSDSVNGWICNGSRFYFYSLSLSPLQECHQLMQRIVAACEDCSGSTFMSHVCLLGARQMMK